MKVAVISDVHANLPALEATLRAIEADGSDELWCLGDLTGYGGDPGPCLEIVLDRAQVCLAGNHDMVITGEIKLDAFSHDARTAAEWTIGVLGAEQLRRLSELRPTGARHDVSLNHGSIRDPVWEYVIDDRTAAICIEHADDGARHDRTQPRAAGIRVCRGHLHRRAGPGRNRDRRAARPLPAQPRLGRPAPRRRPACGLHDGRPGIRRQPAGTGSNTTSRPLSRRSATAGLPARLGTRLAEGY